MIWQQGSRDYYYLTADDKPLSRTLGYVDRPGFGVRPWRAFVVRHSQRPTYLNRFVDLSDAQRAVEEMVSAHAS